MPIELAHPCLRCLDCPWLWSQLYYSFKTCNCHATWFSHLLDQVYTCYFFFIICNYIALFTSLGNHDQGLHEISLTGQLLWFFLNEKWLFLACLISAVLINIRLHQPIRQLAAMHRLEMMIPASVFLVYICFCLSSVEYI